MTMKFCIFKHNKSSYFSTFLTTVLCKTVNNLRRIFTRLFINLIGSQLHFLNIFKCFTNFHIVVLTKVTFISIRSFSFQIKTHMYEQLLEHCKKKVQKKSVIVNHNVYVCVVLWSSLSECVIDVM